MGLKHKVFQFIGNTRIISLSSKILGTFILFVILSNIATNYMQYTLNQNIFLETKQKELQKVTRRVYSYAESLRITPQISEDAKRLALEREAALSMELNSSFFLVVDRSLQIQYHVNDNQLGLSLASIQSHLKNDKAVNQFLRDNLIDSITEGFFTISIDGKKFYANYYYSINWDRFFILLQDYNSIFGSYERAIWFIFSFGILLLIITIFVGAYVLKYLFRYLDLLSEHLMYITKKKSMEILPTPLAKNDTSTFLTLSFNALADTIGRLLRIFTKFTTEDVVIEAYQSGEIFLDGEQEELVCLFSDIRGFTTITEILQTDIVHLLNYYYDRVIDEVVQRKGIVNAIIGDAVLAIFGLLGNKTEFNKSYQAILSGYGIIASAKALRHEIQKKEFLLSEQFSLSQKEKTIFEVSKVSTGIGIDGGNIFYGNIGSLLRMTNTVIGDNVNAASRFEGLTKLYHVPMICSEYVKNDCEIPTQGHRIYFLEIDNVIVKGKTAIQKLYWPIFEQEINAFAQDQIRQYEKALKKYYEGNFVEATTLFQAIQYPIKHIYLERMKDFDYQAPQDWNGAWKMDQK